MDVTCDVVVFDYGCVDYDDCDYDLVKTMVRWRNWTLMAIQMVMAINRCHCQCGYLFEFKKN